ncbi:MAG: hypothetical protein ACR2FZ_00620 [Thermoleophilaceae bacterium]
MGKKIVILVSEPISGDVLKDAVGRDKAEEAEVLVVAPALNDSKVRFWASDPDGSIEHAEDVAEETVERLDEAGVDAAGGTGESDPLLALQDALATFDADEIVLCTRLGGELNWLEEGLVEEVKARFADCEVTHREID